VAAVELCIIKLEHGFCQINADGPVLHLAVLCVSWRSANAKLAHRDAGLGGGNHPFCVYSP
jgi:hypothetical protein